MLSNSDTEAICSLYNSPYFTNEFDTIMSLHRL